MEMFLMVATVSLLGMVVSVGLFAAATRDNVGASEVRPEQPLPLAPPRFFLSERAPAAPMPRVPIEVLLLQIERHVRLEQAAAESFLDAPTMRSLHSRTTSPLVH
jgi:hypothetical protein